MINHYSYTPTPQDMARALRQLADLVKESTGQTPNILVGSTKLYPPKNGSTMSQKSAVAAYDALYGEKGTVVIKDKSTPIFKQQHGEVIKDEFAVDANLNKAAQKTQEPTIKPEERRLSMAESEAIKTASVGKEKYQELLNAHPNTKGFEPIDFKARTQITEGEKLTADKMVEDIAIENWVPVEEYSNAVLNGSTYVDQLGKDTPEAAQYVNEATAAFQDRYFKEVVGLAPAALQPEEPKPEVIPDAPAPEPVEAEPGPEPEIVERESAIQVAKPSSIEIAPVVPLETEIPTEIQPETQPEPEPVEEVLPSLEELSANLTDDGRFEPTAQPPLTLDRQIAQLTAKIESIQAELQSVKQTMGKVAQQEPVVSIRKWAQSKLDTVVNRVQNRAKVDMVKTVGFAKELAQKAMDEIGKTAGQFEKAMLNPDQIVSDLKAVFEIHPDIPKVESGDYSIHKQGENISVSHKDRGEVFKAGENIGSFVGDYNGKDYGFLAKLGETVAVLTGPAAVAVEVAKELAVGAVQSTVKQEAQKSAVRL